MHKLTIPFYPVVLPKRNAESTEYRAGSGEILPNDQAERVVLSVAVGVFCCQSSHNLCVFVQRLGRI
ncbi:hypothetical protein D3C87_2140860 [compost metagenome]